MAVRSTTALRKYLTQRSNLGQPLREKAGSTTGGHVEGETLITSGSYRRPLFKSSQGYLQIRAGHVAGIKASGRLARVSYRPRGGSDTVSLDAQRVIEARGATAVGEAQDPLIGRLLERGLVRLDRHRLGLDVTPDLQAIGASGPVTPGLWALGPLVRGVFWECTAVPDIRLQAAQLAERLGEAFSDPDLARAC